LLLLFLILFSMNIAACGGGGGGSSAAVPFVTSDPGEDPGENPIPNPSSAGGIPVNGYPNWEERAFLVVTNMVRMDPRGYLGQYTTYTNILLEENYPVVGAVYWNYFLNQSARFHALDMGTQDYFAHDSIDGTPWYVRIRSFYPGAAGLWENLAAGTTDPMETLNLLLCEGFPPCAPDLSSEDGHRQNIMAQGARELGTGYILEPASTYRHYWVQDYASNTPMTQPPLVDGSHLAMGTTIYFFANYYDTTDLPPQQLRLVLDGVAYPMSLDLGTDAAGTYALTAGGLSGCGTYYFEAVDGSGDGWRYPGSGEFATFGVAGCTLDYVPD
jgi:hypothetical protein